MTVNKLNDLLILEYIHHKKYSSTFLIRKIHLNKQEVKNTKKELLLKLGFSFAKLYFQCS